MNDLDTVSERKGDLLDLQSEQKTQEEEGAKYCQTNIEVVNHGTYCRKENA